MKAHTPFRSADCVGVAGSGRARGYPNYQIGNPAAEVRIHAADVPPLAAYEEWFAADCKRISRHSKVTGARLHRIIQMMRSGSTAAGAGRAFGLSGSCILRWVSRLPAELRP